ncbi:MAG: M28 family peptidase [Planctomycetota bacterium]|jgi:Zn-dependent M28 family amino/carboxypeptidase
MKRFRLASALLVGLCASCTQGVAIDLARPATVGTDVEPTRPVSADGLREILLALPPRRSIGTRAHLQTRDLIESALRRIGHEPARLPFTWPLAPEADLANVEVRIPGATSDAPILVVSAHYDSVAETPGADDNGSGTAGLLELARRLSGRRFESEVRLLFFDCEEPGLIGAGNYVSDIPADELARMVGVINLETMGYTDRRAGSQELPPGARALFDPGDTGDFLMIVGNQQSAPLASEVAAAMAMEEGPGFRAETFSDLPGAGWLMPDSRRSDHSRFWDVRVPALLLTDTANLRNPHYHRSTDVVETLDLEFLAAAIRGVERAVERIAVPRDG